GERRLQVSLAEQRLQDTVGCHHHRKAWTRKWREPDVAADQRNVFCETRSFRAGTGTRQHRLGSIDADKTDTGAAERQRDAACAASQLENGTTCLQGEIPPEGNVTLAKRARVLPVVERGVLVPALVALHYAFCPTVAKSIVF